MAIIQVCGTIVVLLEVFFSVHGARLFDLNERINHRMRMFRGQDPPDPDQMLGLTGGEHLIRVRSSRTARGSMKTKYQETYHDLPIIGETVVIGNEEDGQYTGEISGSVVEDLEADLLSTEPQITIWNALDIAVQSQNDDPEEVIFDPETNSNLEIILDKGVGQNAVPHLVYSLSYRIVTTNKISRPFFIINANTGKIYQSWQGLDSLSASYGHHSRQDQDILIEGMGGNEKIGEYTYGIDRPELSVTMVGPDTCSLENQYVRVIDKRTGKYGSGHRFSCTEGNNDEINGAYSPLNDVYFHCNVVTNMYQEWFDTTPLNDQIQAIAHVGEQFENAYWDGRSVNFGDGNMTFYPFITLDVVSHEIGHGVTEQNSGLKYSGQSGGINEAFSDISGEAAEWFLADWMSYEGPDWMVGHGFYKAEGAMRYFEDPTQDGVSIGHCNDFCPGINVHYSSGVYNRAFYILSNKVGWTVKKAYEVFYQANRLYWGPDSTYAMAACGVKHATKDLGYNEEDVADSFRQVGVELCVESKTGIMSMVDIKGYKGDVHKYNWYISEDINYIRVELIGDRWYSSSGEADLFVDTYSSTESGSNELIEIFSPEAGMHEVIVEGADDFSKLTLLALSNFSEWIDFFGEEDAEGNTFTFHFNVPEEVATSGHGIAVRSHTGNNFMFGRYDEAPDVVLHKYDFLGSYLGHEEEATTLLICRPRAGTIYVTIDYYSTSHFSIYLMHILDMVA